MARYRNHIVWPFGRLPVLAALLSLAVTLNVAADTRQNEIYEYTNKHGGRVISNTIPPEAIRTGYKVLNKSTREVIRVVPPAPDPEVLRQQEAELAALNEKKARYEELAKRYSSENEIYAARDRRLAQVDANIAILRSNIGNISNHIESLMKKAAEIERAGREVPRQHLKTLEETREELRIAQSMLQEREREHNGIHQEYEEMVDLFRWGQTLFAKK